METTKKKDITEAAPTPAAEGERDKEKYTQDTPALERNGTHLRVTLGAKLIMAEVPTLQGTLRREIADGARELVFDMKDTNRIDSSGIGLLVAVSNSLAAVQGTMRLVNTIDSIYELLQDLRLTVRIQVFPDEGEPHHE